MKRTCNICMEDHEAKHEPATYMCNTCQGGYVCKGCIGVFDPYGSAWQKMPYVKKTIKCPCCRQLNWKYQFSQIIWTTLEHDCVDYESDCPAIVLYVKNTHL